MKNCHIDYEPLKRSHLWDKEPAAQLVAPVGFAGADTIPTTSKTEPEAWQPVEPREKLWIVRRGHLLSYLGLFLFTTVVYFRPYELIPALRGATSIAFWIAVVTLAIFIPSQISVDNRLIPRIKEARLVLFLGLAGLLSVPFADDPTRAWATFADFTKVVVMFVVMASVVRTPGRLKGLILLSFAVCVYLAVGAIAQHNSGTFIYDGYRVSGNLGNMFTNPNDLALFLVTMLPLLIGLTLFTRNAFIKLTYVVIAILALITIVLTYSRGGFIALVAAVGVLVWKLQKQNRVVLVPVVLIILLFVALAPNKYGSRVASIGSNDDGSVVSRRDDIKRSILVALRHPLFGIGMDNYVLRSNGNHATHNSYTQVAAEMGLPAFVVYIMFLMVPMKRLRNVERETLATRKKDRLYYLSVGLQAALVGYFVGSFFASVVYLWNVYYLVGYAICIDRLYQAQRFKDKPTAQQVEYPVTV
jgi:putative inorganic carbon (hco3(-)) transporter